MRSRRGGLDSVQWGLAGLGRNEEQKATAAGSASATPMCRGAEASGCAQATYCRACQDEQSHVGEVELENCPMASEGEG
eukprot:1357708-Amphidinium_carterae.1